jgi:glycerol uptake facilitator protein
LWTFVLPVVWHDLLRCIAQVIASRRVGTSAVNTAFRLEWPCRKAGWLMSSYVAEFVGTAILVLLGNGVVANVVLKQTKGNQAGWLAIAAGWGLAVYVAVASVADFSGAHINPAVTVGLAAAGRFALPLVPGYLVAQFLGAGLGALLVFVFYREHYAVSDDADDKLGTFCTGPAIRSRFSNWFSEMLGTFLLVLVVLLFATPKLTLGDADATATLGLGAVGALPVGLLVFSIGLSLGGTTGYAINPARDLSPRLMHALLPIPQKRDSDWSYAWVPIFGPFAGALLAAVVYRCLG